MRIDHHAYQRATRVALLGLLLQAAIAITLLVFGLASRDTTFIISALYGIGGVLVWVGLVAVFNQHKLERLEALEEDEISSRLAGADVSEGRESGDRPAARRLALMHTWFLPGLSLVIALVLAGLALLILRQLRLVDAPVVSEADAVEFHRTAQLGWAVAICLGFAAVSFVFSRFVAGMAKHAAWRNLRGGAAFVVGNALILLAVATGTIFRFFENERIIEYVAYAIPVLMLVLAAEIAFNFVLNLYRPRIPGEVPRPAFDSGLLSMLSTPDSLVRSINEAVNYQFGFDITSSWGYRLLLRSVLWLAGLGFVALVVLSMLVVVEPHQQAVRLRGGKIVGEVHGSGILWKLPWPFESAEVYDVGRIRELPLTARIRTRESVNLWVDDLQSATDLEIKPFIVSSGRTGSQSTSAGDSGADRVSSLYSLIATEIILQYRIKHDGLRDFLEFAADNVARRQRLTDRERSLQAIALAESTAQLSRMGLDDILGAGRAGLPASLAAGIQRRFDQYRAGVEVVSVNMPMVRPHDYSAKEFEELNISREARLQAELIAERNVVRTFAYLLGDTGLVKQEFDRLDAASGSTTPTSEKPAGEPQPDLASATADDEAGSAAVIDMKVVERVLGEIENYDALRRDLGPTDPKTLEQQARVERLIVAGGGDAAQAIMLAETDRWLEIMNNRARGSRVSSELAAYRAAPELYRQRAIMRVLSERLPGLRKYVFAIDPSRAQVEMDLAETNPLLNFSESQPGSQGTSQ